MTRELLSRHAAHSRPSVRVVQAVAHEESIDPLDITTPLADVIDPEALDALVESDRSLSTISFRYSGYEVTVYADGGVSTNPLSK
ncbi:HalOD1 output domain-containing protein [Haloferax namakaokahaiae]|uniref:HalOD1 output domain-containing protein n=1 Tax=Haloferax namakaokahaiae TaxID=1748331 RepID=A0ABD5ZBF7_9EURY